MTRPRLLVAADPAGAARVAAEEVVRHARGAIAARGRFTVALAGGATPRRLHALLAGAFGGSLDWSRVVVLFGDERCVPPDHPASNFRMARETLLAHLPIPPGRVLRWPGEDPDPARAAAWYAGALRASFPTGASDRPPSLDLVLLGMGPDGHVASLFSGTTALAEQNALTAAPWVSRLGAHRLTLTFPVIDAARAVLLLVTGADKADRIAEAYGNHRAAPDALPVQRVHPASGDLTVVLDAAAAAALRGGPAVETGPTGGNVV